MGRPPFASITQALGEPSAPLFWRSSGPEGTRPGDPESFFARASAEDLSFDVSNNKVLANVGPAGAIARLTIYRGCHAANTHPRSWPGVWTHKDFTAWGPYSFRLRLGATVTDLGTNDWPRRTSLLGGFFPFTEIDGGEIHVSLLCFAPILSDGTERPRGVVYGAAVRNAGAGRLSGSVLLPELFREDNMIRDVRLIRGGIPITSDAELALADDRPQHLEVSFSLSPGESIWIPAVLYAPGEPTPQEIDRLGSLGWLNETWAFHESMTGELRVPNDRFQEAFLPRAAAQCFGCVSMDREGKVIGSNWGTSPPTVQTWMRDFYYSVLPLHMLEPRLFAESLRWYLDHSVRYRGATHLGGVTHSLANAVAPLNMAGLYYRATGDRTLFLRDPGIRDRMGAILADVEASRADGSPWLFPSRYLSDGEIRGDYHTGTNVALWHALRSAELVFREVYGDTSRALSYGRLAERVRADIEARCTVSGPFGRQYIEVINADGKVPYMVHDGEENDTTLMSFYGYCALDHLPFRNYARFALSEHNSAYSPLTRGIRWGSSVDQAALSVPATFPGYVTALLNAIGQESGEELAEIRRLTDLDGSIWWWPYSGPAETKYGEVARGIGKSGWASGVYLALWISEILGLRFDALRREFRFRPLRPAAPFGWERLRLGSGRFAAGFDRNGDAMRSWVRNDCDHPISVLVELVPDPGVELRNVKPTHRTARASRGSLFGRPTALVSAELAPGERLEASAGP